MHFLSTNLKHNVSNYLCEDAGRGLLLFCAAIAVTRYPLDLLAA